MTYAIARAVPHMRGMHRANQGTTARSRWGSGRLARSEAFGRPARRLAALTWQSAVPSRTRNHTPIRSIDPHNQYCTALDGTPLAPLGGMTNFLMQAYVVLLLFILRQIIDNKEE